MQRIIEAFKQTSTFSSSRWKQHDMLKSHSAATWTSAQISARICHVAPWTEKRRRKAVKRKCISHYTSLFHWTRETIVPCFNLISLSPPPLCFLLSLPVCLSPTPPPSPFPRVLVVFMSHSVFRGQLTLFSFRTNQSKKNMRVCKETE